MNTSTDREAVSRPRRSLPRNVRFFSLALVSLVILSLFVFPPDAMNVLGLSSSPASGNSTGCSYQVRPGDNLYRIGLSYGVSYQYLAAMNGIYDPDVIMAGSVLSVPCGPNAQPRLPSQPCGADQSHVVIPGDNLFRIALVHGSTVDLLRSANNLYGRVLRPGVSLIVPCAGLAGNAPVPPTRAGQVVVAPAAPTAAETLSPPIVTPQVTPLSPGSAFTPAVTLIAPPAATLAVGTPVNPAAAPLAVTTPVPVSVNSVVSMRGNQFVKDVVQISVGGRVTWVNEETDGTGHTVTCAECPPSFSFDSGSSPIGPGKRYSVLFTTPGVYFYYSRLQPNMIGMIIVNP